VKMEKVTDLQYWMDTHLKTQLNTICYNMGRDWDFVVIVTGSGLVRVGKSVIAQQAGYYVAHKMGTPFTLKNVVFDSEELMKTAHQLPLNSVIVYDEARATLDAKKVMERISKTLMDFFAECGMYNHLIILVLPDFFELNRRMATTRSDALINVFRSAEEKKLQDGTEVLNYKRGYFEFYGKRRKKELYIKGKKAYDNYGVGKRNFWGEFREFWVVDKEEYMKKKVTFLRRDRSKKDTHIESRLGITFKVLCRYESQRKVSELLTNEGYKVSQGRINQLIKSISTNTPVSSYDK